MGTLDIRGCGCLVFGQSIFNGWSIEFLRTKILKFSAKIPTFYVKHWIKSFENLKNWQLSRTTMKKSQHVWHPHPHPFKCGCGCETLMRISTDADIRGCWCPLHHYIWPFIHRNFLFYSHLSSQWDLEIFTFYKVFNPFGTSHQFIKELLYRGNANIIWITNG